MDKKENNIKTNPRNFWDWLWNSDSFLSYVVLLVIMFVIVKFIFLPGLGFLMGTSLPLAIVESSSMDHRYIGSEEGGYEICGKTLAEEPSMSFEKYWWTCGDWYENNTKITKEEFAEFKMSNGFKKGDLIIITGKQAEEIKIGDILIFKAGTRAHPVIHRVIAINSSQDELTFSTKGDHNPGQLDEEKAITENQILGVAKGRIPYVGWVKLFFVEMMK